MDANRPIACRHAICFFLLVLSAIGLITPAWPASAATEVLYVRQTGHYMRGTFRDFWDKNGGLPNFGYPITEEYIDPATGRIYQYFERARFERAHADDTTVVLTDLGRIFLGPRTFPRANPIQNSAQRRYIPETRHIIQYGFKEVWETRGAERIFGFPLSDEIGEQLADGQTYTVQYFERARFEFRPSLLPGQRVVISDLGRVFAPPSLTAPLAPSSPPPGPISLTAPAPTSTPVAPGQPTPTARPPAPTPTAVPSAPALVRPAVPASRNSRVLPQAGLPGQVFTFDAAGFRASERVSFWLNLPDGTVQPINRTATADSRGSVTAAGIEFRSDSNSPAGIWSFVGQGEESKSTAVGYFLLLSSAIGRAPPPPQGVPPSVNARVEPAAGPVGTIFFLNASGFRPNEEVQVAVVASNGQRTNATFGVNADSRGSIDAAGIYFLAVQGSPLGLYSFVATGNDSGAVSTGYFVVTSPE